MASESETAQTQTRSIFQRLATSRNRDLSLFLPFLFGLHGSDPDQNSENGSDPQTQNESIVLINPLTQGMVVIEGASLSSLLRSDPEKNGRPPASKASIESLPSVEIGENEAGECAICLEEWEFGANRVAVKEMPCEHRFHGDCVEKWLGIHGSCPVCRFEMPFDQEEKKNGGGDRTVWVGFTFGRRNPGRSSSAHVDQRADDDADSGRVDSESGDD